MLWLDLLDVPPDIKKRFTATRQCHSEQLEKPPVYANDPGWLATALDHAMAEGRRHTLRALLGGFGGSFPGSRVGSPNGKYLGMFVTVNDPPRSNVNVGLVFVDRPPEETRAECGRHGAGRSSFAPAPAWLW